NLCHFTDKGTQGKFIHFFSPGTETNHYQKCTADHEADMCKADAALLHHVTADFISEVQKPLRAKELESPNSNTAVELLRVCWHALSPKGDTGEQFGGMAPYSQALIFVAAGYLKLCLDTLDCRNLHHRPHIKNVFRVLYTLAEK